jgi:hypothetical protein
MSAAAWHTVVNEGSGILLSPSGHVITAAHGVIIRAVRSCLAWL